MRPVVGQNDHGRPVCKQCFGGPMELVKVGEAFVGRDSSVLLALQDDSLGGEAQSLGEIASLGRGGDNAASRQGGGGEGAFDQFQSEVVVDEQQNFHLFDQRTEACAEASLGGQPEWCAGTLHAEAGFRTGSISGGEDAGDVSGERPEPVSVEAWCGGDSCAENVAERLVREVFFAVHCGEGDLTAQVGGGGSGNWKYSGRET